MRIPNRWRLKHATATYTRHIHPHTDALFHVCIKQSKDAYIHGIKSTHTPHTPHTPHTSHTPHVYIYTCTHIRIHARIHALINVLTHMYSYTHTCKFIAIESPLFSNASPLPCLESQTCVQTYIHQIRTYTYTRIHACIYAYMHCIP